MPRVPQVTGPSVAQQPITGGFARSPDQPIVDRQTEELSRAMMTIGSAIQEREDADLVMRAEADIKSRYLEWEGEAKQRKGQAAWGVAKEAAGWWDENTTKISEGLQNPLQKRLFQQTVTQMRGQSIGAFSGYEAGQRRESLDASTQASIVGSINLAAANPQDPVLLQAAKQDLIKRNEMRAKLNGWDVAIRDAKQTEYLTNFHKQVIQGLVRDNPTAAETYFQANKAEIEGTQQAEIGAFAARATATRIGDTMADAVWQMLGPKTDRDPVSLDVMERQLRKELTGKDEAIKNGIAGLRERTAAFKDSRRERDDQLEASVNQAILDGASARQVRAMPSFLSLSPEAGRKIIDFMENKALRAEQTAAARESRAAVAESREQGRLARQGMGAYLTYSNPDTLSGMTEAQVLNLLPSLGNELTHRLMEQRRTLGNPLKLAEARIDSDDFNQIAQQMGLRPFAAKTEKEKADLGTLKYRVEQMISAVQQGGKKVLARDEKLALMRQEMARTVTVDTFWSRAREVPVIALKPEEIKSVEVPAQDRREIADSMRAMARKYPGDPRFAPTEDNLKRWYLKSKSQAAGLIQDGR